MIDHLDDFDESDRLAAFLGLRDYYGFELCPEFATSYEGNARRGNVWLTLPAQETGAHRTFHANCRTGDVMYIYPGSISYMDGI